jgi:hypothetical protein
MNRKKMATQIQKQQLLSILISIYPLPKELWKLTSQYYWFNFIVTCVAGNGEEDHVDGQGLETQLDSVAGGVMDHKRKRIVFTDNHTVRSFCLLSQTITTIAGVPKGFGCCDGFCHPPPQPPKSWLDQSPNETLQQENADHPGGMMFTQPEGFPNQAKFYFISGIALDPTNQTLLVSDTNNRIVRIDESKNSVITIAGDIKDDYVSRMIHHYGELMYQDGQGEQAKFNKPKGICCDSKGTIYVADSLNRSIRRIIKLQQSTFAKENHDEHTIENASLYNVETLITLSSSSDQLLLNSNNENILYVSTSSALCAIDISSKIIKEIYSLNEDQAYSFVFDSLYGGGIYGVESRGISYLNVQPRECQTIPCYSNENNNAKFEFQIPMAIAIDHSQTASTGITTLYVLDMGHYHIYKLTS